MASQNDWVPARCRSLAALERLRGGPVNCLVVDWPGADPTLIRRAREAGFAVGGDAGKDGFRLIGPPEATGDFLIPAAPLGALPRSSPESCVVVRGCVWPGIRTGPGGSADAGPTGAPWINANGWVARLAHALEPGKIVWLDFGPPAGAVLDVNQWRLAAAEAAVHGVRWILPAAASEDSSVWNAVSGTLAFFAAHRAWPREPVAPLALISDFAGPGEYLSHEFLNLSARRNLPARILVRERATGLSWDGLSTLVYADSEAPGQALLARLTGAAKAGALLVVPPSFARLIEGAEAGPAPCPGYRMLAVGKGRAAIAGANWDDPFLLVGDVQDLIGRRNAPLRLWNGTSIIPYPAGERNRLSVLHLIKYTSRPGDPITLGLPGRPRGATLHTLEGKIIHLEAHPARHGVEFHLPPFAVYGALVPEG